MHGVVLWQNVLSVRGQWRYKIQPYERFLRKFDSWCNDTSLCGGRDACENNLLVKLLQQNCGWAFERRLPSFEWNEFYTCIQRCHKLSEVSLHVHWWKEGEDGWTCIAHSGKIRVSACPYGRRMWIISSHLWLLIIHGVNCVNNSSEWYSWLKGGRVGPL